MAEIYTHNCIKCQTSYTDVDVDAYLCASCNEEKKKVALDVDKKYPNTVGQQPSGGLREYDEFIKANGGRFPSTSQLGINLL